MSFQIGDRVQIKDKLEEMPHPQWLYAGQAGTVIRVNYYVYVSPDNPLSGVDNVAGVSYLEKDLEAIAQ